MACSSSYLSVCMFDCMSRMCVLCENRPCTDPDFFLTHPIPYSFIFPLPSTADAVMPDGSFKELTLAQYKGKFLVLVMYPRT